MALDTHRVAELVALTRKVFADIPRPDCTRHVARALDDDWIVSPERWKELQALDPEQHWWEVSDEDLDEYSDTLNFYTPEGFRFYYPAFLTYTLRHWNEPHHSTVHGRTLTVIEDKRQDIKQMTSSELVFIEEVIVELSCDSDGRQYHCIPSLRLIEKELERRQREPGL